MLVSRWRRYSQTVLQPMLLNIQQKQGEHSLHAGHMHSCNEPMHLNRGVCKFMECSMLGGVENTEYLQGIVMVGAV